MKSTMDRNGSWKSTRMWFSTDNTCAEERRIPAATLVIIILDVCAVSCWFTNECNATLIIMTDITKRMKGE